MTVKELRSQLKQFEDGMEVQVCDPHTGKFSNDVSIEMGEARLRIIGNRKERQ